MLLPAFISHVHAAREGLKLGPESGFYGFHHTTLLLKVAQIVKILPAMQETRLRSLGWEDSLEKGMATHSSTLAWKIPWMEEPGRLQSMGSQRAGHDCRD